LDVVRARATDAPDDLPGPRVRRARPAEAEAIALILHQSAVDMYDRFAVGRERALRTLERAVGEPGNVASAEVVWVVELDGSVAAAMTAFPVQEAARRSRAFLRLALRAAPLWHWPRAVGLFWRGGRASPGPPARALYIDALAVDPSFRRRGAARALLAQAERQARSRGLPSVALDTTVDNAAARALYAAAGFREVATRRPLRGLPAFLGLVKGLR
jgi:ribosomal protein S18 acetylase RimI-like enzyme